MLSALAGYGFARFSFSGSRVQRAQNSGNAQIFPLVVIGGLVTIIPLIALFLLLQRYWRSGLLLGSLAN